MAEKNARQLILKLVDGTTVKGWTNIRNFNRLSDALNSDDKPFVTLFDVSMQGHVGQVLLVNKRQVMWTMPLDDGD